MGYTTEFDGAVDVVPPLNPAEIAYLRKFSQTRRMARSRGPYFVDGSGDWGQGRDADIDDYNQPPQGQPGLWCQWEPTDDGSTIEWNGGEKFYDAEEWMAYLIDHFLKPGGEAASSGEQQFADFTFDHVVNGTIEAQGERSDDVWRLIVHDNVVTRIEPTITWPGEETLPASVNGEQPAIAGEVVVTPLDTNAEAYVVAAFRWAMRDDRFDEVRKCVNRLRTSGEVLAALQVCRDLAAVLERRHHEIATQMLSDLETEMVAAAALTPDALPDDIGDGFAINGRQ